MNTSNNPAIQEDEIDLRELFKTILKNKKTIAAITLFITLSALVYVLIAPKVYEAKAVLKIGEYKLTNTNNQITIADSSELSKELEILFIFRT